MALQDLLQNVMVTLENVSDTLADMHLYPLEVERVAEDIKKLQVGIISFFNKTSHGLVSDIYFSGSRCNSFATQHV